MPFACTQVRVKALDKKSEDLVPLSDLPRFLQAALSGAHDPSRVYGSTAGASSFGSSSGLQRSHSSSDFGARGAGAAASLDAGDEGWHHGGAAGEGELVGKRGAMSVEQRERERNERFHASERDREATGRHQQHHHQHHGGAAGGMSRRGNASRWY